MPQGGTPALANDQTLFVQSGQTFNLLRPGTGALVSTPTSVLDSGISAPLPVAGRFALGPTAALAPNGSATPALVTGPVALDQSRSLVALAPTNGAAPAWNVLSLDSVARSAGTVLDASPQGFAPALSQSLEASWPASVDSLFQSGFSVTETRGDAFRKTNDQGFSGSAWAGLAGAGSLETQATDQRLETIAGEEPGTTSPIVSAASVVPVENIDSAAAVGPVVEVTPATTSIAQEERASRPHGLAMVLGFLAGGLLISRRGLQENVPARPRVSTRKSNGTPKE